MLPMVLTVHLLSIHNFLVLLIQSPTPGADVVGWLLGSAQWAVAQFQAKNYIPGCGMIVMMLVWGAKKFFGDKLQTEKLAMLSAGLGVLSAMAMEALGLAMGADKFDVLRALANGLVVGGTASGFWSLLGKKLFGSHSPSA